MTAEVRASEPIPQFLLTATPSYVLREREREIEIKLYLDWPISGLPKIRFRWAGNALKLVPRRRQDEAKPEHRAKIRRSQFLGIAQVSLEL